jgi:hypothetical protein
MNIVIKNIIIANIGFICLWFLGNSISSNLKDYGVTFYLFALISISFLVGYSSISILEIIKNKMFRILIGIVIYGILLFVYMSLQNKLNKWVLISMIVLAQISVFYSCLRVFGKKQ